MSAGIYLILFMAAPWIAMFFEQPCLTDLSRFIFLAFFISSFGISTNAYMTKNMMNKEITVVNTCALICSALSLSSSPSTASRIGVLPGSRW